TLISGVCSAGVTFHTTWKPTKIANTKTMRLKTIGSTPAVMICPSKEPASRVGRAGERSASRYDGAVLAHQRRLDDLVVLRHREVARLGIEREREEVEHVARIERGCIGCQPRRQVAEA